MLDRYLSQVTLLPELTLADVGRYLSSKQPFDIVGYAAICSHCLIAETVYFLYPDKGLEGHTMCDAGMIFLDAHYNEFVLPVGIGPISINMLMIVFDRVVDTGEAVTKQYLLEYLSLYRPELLDALAVSDSLKEEVKA
jgi:hypothetical protein